MRRHGLHQVSAPSSAQMCLRLVSRRGPHVINMGSAVATTRHRVTTSRHSVNLRIELLTQECDAKQDIEDSSCTCRICKRCTMCKTIQHLLGFVGLHWNSRYRIIHYWPKWDLTVPTVKLPSEGSSAKLVQLECTEASLAKHACIQVIPFHHELWYDVMGRPGSKKDLRSDMKNS